MKTFTLGITGTRSGMNAEQRHGFEMLLKSLKREHGSGLCLIHGEAPGVDTEAAQIAEAMGVRVLTPRTPLDEYGRGHFARNREIVDRSDLLIVIPWQDQWQPEGGTWYTHDYAEKNDRDVLVIWPSAQVNQLISQGR